MCSLLVRMYCLCLISCSFSIGLCPAQEAWFNSYDLGFSLEDCTDLQEFGGNLFLTTFSQGLDTTNRNELICLNDAGEIQWRRFIRYPENTADGDIAFRVKGMVIAKDSSIYVYTESLNLGKRQRCVLNKFSFYGGLVWLEEYGEDGGNVFPARYGICLAPDSMEVYTCGILDYGSGDENVVIYKVDTSGVVVDRILVEVIEKRVSIRVPLVSLPDSTLLFAYNYRSSSDSALKDYIVRVSTSGEIEDVAVNLWPEGVGDLKGLTNADVIYMSREPDFWTGGMRVCRLSSQLDTTWSFLYNDPELPYPFVGNSNLLNLSIGKDGRILAAGYNIDHAMLLCFSSDGVLLWRRKIALEGFSSISFASASWTATGSVVLCGGLFHIQDSCAFQSCSDIFIFKLDSVGCLEPNCGEVSVISKTQDSPRPQHEFILFPNPAFEEIYLSYSGNLPSNLGCEARVMDAFGTIVKSFQIDSRSTLIELSGVPSGLYFVHVECNRMKYVLPFIIH